MKSTRFLPLFLIALRLACPARAADTGSSAHWPTVVPAQMLSTAVTAPLLAAARAGNRVVAVGDHGVVLLSDDGVNFRQARTVPVRALLTTVQFVDAKHGYAGGHDGVVLETLDGGDTWALLRSTPGVEQPILSLHFDSPQHGIGVGLYGWAIETSDAGRTWSEFKVESGDDTDRHLFHVFASSRGTQFIASEGGTVYRSIDHGKTWQGVATGNKGSLWYGLALSDGTLLVCGMRGHLYRSGDDGQTWQSVDSDTTQSLTGMTELSGGRIVVVGMSGTLLSSTDGHHFVPMMRTEQESLTAVLADGMRPLLMSMAGPLSRAGPAKP